jgi:hypothetical protein
MEVFTEDSLLKKKCPELKQICKDRKLPCSGTKAVLISRILGLKEPAPKPRHTTSKKVQPQVKCAAIEHLLKQAPSVVIFRSESGHYKHAPTGFVFNPETKHVIGRDTPEGIVNLKISDLAACKEHGFLIDETCVDKEFSQENGDRMSMLLNYMDGPDSDSEEEPACI